MPRSAGAFDGAEVGEGALHCAEGVELDVCRRRRSRDERRCVCMLRPLTAPSRYAEKEVRMLAQRDVFGLIA